MQAHLLSSPAARITSSPRPTSSDPSRPSSAPTPIRVPPLNAPTRLSALPTPSVADSVGLAHDAGNLLAALGLYCDLLSVPGVLRPEHQHYATELSLISNRSSTLIQRLIARPPAAKPSTALHVNPSSNSARRSNRGSQSEIASDASNLAAVLRDLAPVLQRIAAGTARVSVSCPLSLPSLDFTSDILERLVVNLVRNAADAIRIQRSSTDSPACSFPRGIRVSLNLVPTDNPAADDDAAQLQLTVEDDGPGMPPDLVAEFLHPSPLPPGATHGLGHRIVHDLAAATGAHLAIRVLPGKGTIISLLWPIPAPLFPCSPRLKPSSIDSPGSTSTQSSATPSQGSATC